MPKRNSFTFIDVIVGTALVLIVFLGIFGAYQLGIKVVGQSKNKIMATAIANEWMEKIRNLPYGAVGTIGAELPYVQGSLESAATTSLNNIEYAVETQIKYISDPADGVGAEDSCNLDYKRAEVKVSWAGRFSGDIKLVTDLAPKNKIEELFSCEQQPGGILSVSVFDAYGIMVAFPLINVYDPDTETLVDSVSPPSGEYDFPLAAATYKVEVLKDGFNLARSYGTDEVAIPENACYARPHQQVLEGQLIPVSFCIDRTSTFSVDALSPWGTGYFSDSFDDNSKIFEMSQVVVSGGEVNLATSTEGYLPDGFLISTNISPISLLHWDEFVLTDAEPPDTDLTYQIYYATDTDWFLIPDADLVGNSEGFDISPVDLSGLDVAEYPQLKIRADFITNSTSTSSTLRDWQVSWITSVATPISYAVFHLQGVKLIGLDGGEAPVYKYSQNHTSNSQGQISIAGLEWDSYTFSVDPATGLDLTEIDPAPQPVSLVPDTTVSVDLYLEAENSFLLTVQNSQTLEPIFAATVRLYNSGLSYDSTLYTDTGGQTYFIPLEAATYNLEISAPGYLNYTGTAWVSGDGTDVIGLEQIE